MKMTYYLMIVTLIMALMVGCFVGICIGKSMQPVIIQTGESYEYYNQESQYEDTKNELKTWNF